MNIELSKSQMYKPGTLFLHEQIGEATSDEGAYRMLLINGHIPAIRSENTGQTFAFSWEDLLRISIASGVDKLPEEPEE